MSFIEEQMRKLIDKCETMGKEEIEKNELSMKDLIKKSEEYKDTIACIAYSFKLNGDDWFHDNKKFTPELKNSFFEHMDGFEELNQWRYIFLENADVILVKQIRPGSYEGALLHSIGSNELFEYFWKDETLSSNEPLIHDQFAEELMDKVKSKDSIWGTRLSNLTFAYQNTLKGLKESVKKEHVIVGDNYNAENEGLTVTMMKHDGTEWTAGLEAFTNDQYANKLLLINKDRLPSDGWKIARAANGDIFVFRKADNYSMEGMKLGGETQLKQFSKESIANNPNKYNFLFDKMMELIKKDGNGIYNNIWSTINDELVENNKDVKKPLEEKVVSNDSFLIHAKRIINNFGNKNEEDYRLYLSELKNLTNPNDSDFLDGMTLEDMRENEFIVSYLISRIINPELKDRNRIVFARGVSHGLKNDEQSIEQRINQDPHILVTDRVLAIRGALDIVDVVNNSMQPISNAQLSSKTLCK